MSHDEVILVISTFPDAETAHRIATELVTGRLAACANILPSVRSIYRWQGAIEDTPETMVFFKTTAARFPEFQQKLRALHPYEVPEIVTFGPADGLPEYLRWVAESCAEV
jgi:periplasmic divalent cation tolerance protein